MGIEIECEHKIEVSYKGIRVGHFMADIIVGNCVVIENKAVQTLTKSHKLQLVNYLSATDIKVGLLLNFGSDKLEYKRKYASYRPSNF